MTVLLSAALLAVLSVLPVVTIQMMAQGRLWYYIGAWLLMIGGWWLLIHLLRMNAVAIASVVIRELS